MITYGRNSYKYKTPKNIGYLVNKYIIELNNEKQIVASYDQDINENWQKYRKQKLENVSPKLIYFVCKNTGNHVHIRILLDKHPKAIFDLTKNVLMLSWDRINLVQNDTYLMIKQLSNEYIEQLNVPIREYEQPYRVCPRYYPLLNLYMLVLEVRKRNKKIHKKYDIGLLSTMPKDIIRMILEKVPEQPGTRYTKSKLLLTFINFIS